MLCAQVGDLVAGFAELTHDGVLDLDPRVIRATDDLHAGRVAPARAGVKRELRAAPERGA